MSEERGALGRVHIMGIGGAGMSGIARILIAQGVAVSGCDARDSRRITALSALGATIHLGHSADHLSADALDSIIVSTAIPTDSPEVMAALERGIAVQSRGTALAGLVAGHTAVAVAGTHGKTTTTSMLTVALQHCGADPSFAIGSELNESGSNAHRGSGPEFIVEADESDGSFLQLPATLGIVTNVEPDHLNYWGTFDRIEAAFLEFAVGLAGGPLVTCADDPGAARLAASARAAGVEVLTYGVDLAADVRIELREAHGFDLVNRGVRVPGFALQVPGLHNIWNATAAFVAAVSLGFSPADVRDGLAGFTGTRRRFDFRGTADGVRVYDDYAHHPTEIAATLRAAREVVGNGRIVVAFQAHHYYRTAMFVTEFGAALGLADAAVVLEVYAPGEELIPGASGQSMAAAVPLPAEDVRFEPSWSAVAAQLVDRAKSGDLIMTLGAGDIGLLAPEVLELLRCRAADARP